MAVKASEVICPDVAEERTTARKGPRREGKSNVVMSSMSASKTVQTHPCNQQVLLEVWRIPP